MAGHVYLIGSPVFHWYKIGKSKDASIRVTELGILLPFRVELVAVWHVLDHHEQERLLHEKYAEHRINGEWFNFNHNEVRRLLIDMSAAQVRTAAGFSNIERDSIENVLRVKKHLPISKDRYPKGKTERRARGGMQVRMGALVKESQLLRARIFELEKKLDNQDLPII